MVMASLKAFLGSSIGKKKIVGITGLAISLFTLAHMSGNLLLFVGPEAYNTYGHKLITNPLIELAELGLVVFFLTHVFFTIQLVRANRNARPVGYQKSAFGVKQTSFAAKTAILSGLLLFAFVVLHLRTFKYGPIYTVNYNGTEMRDLYTLVVESFKNPGYVAWYVFSLLLLGLHLAHGVKASFQSLGAYAANRPCIRWLGLVFAILVAGGFISQPLAIYFFGLGG